MTVGERRRCKVKVGGIKSCKVKVGERRSCKGWRKEELEILEVWRRVSAGLTFDWSVGRRRSINWPVQTSFKDFKPQPERSELLLLLAELVSTSPTVFLPGGTLEGLFTGGWLR